MSQPRRIWNTDIDRDTPCRICGLQGRTERAHVSGRAYDRRQGKTRIVDPETVVPLCGPFGDSQACHTRVDRGEIDLLPYLTVEEQARAVSDLGGIELARKRLAPTDYHRAIDEARREVLEASL